MNTCTCPVCNKESVVPLPCEKWVLGQRVKQTYHFVMENYQEKPEEYTGVIVPCPEDCSINKELKHEGVWVLWDNGCLRWHWDYAVESGGGPSHSPLMEEENCGQD